MVNLLSEDVISEVQGQGKNVLVSADGGWNPVIAMPPQQAEVAR